MWKKKLIPGDEDESPHLSSDEEVKPWKPHIDYEEGDLVKHGGKIYKGILNHKSLPSKTPNKETDKWIEDNN